MAYDNEIPIPDKFLMPDGSIVTFAGAEYAPADEDRAIIYAQMQYKVAKWLLPDGSIVSGIPMDMEAFEAIFVPKTTEINGHPLSGDITLTADDLGIPDPLIYKGAINCSSNPNYPAADAGHYYKISADGKIGGASGYNIKSGDALICNTDGTPAGTEAGVGNKWDKLQGDISIPKTGTAENDFMMSGSSPFAWTSKTKEQATAVLEHNNLQGLQGGIEGEYYHLNALELAAVQALGSMSAQDASNVAITGGSISDVTIAAKIIIKSASVALTAAECTGTIIHLYRQTLEATLELPAAFANGNFVFIVDATVAKYVRLDPTGSEVQSLDGIDLTAGYYVGLTTAVKGAVIQYITIQTGASTYQWAAFTVSGAWTPQT